MFSHFVVQLKGMTANECHYANRPMRYTAIFHRCKNGDFQLTNLDIFYIFAQNIDCWDTLELPH